MSEKTNQLTSDLLKSKLTALSTKLTPDNLTTWLTEFNLLVFGLDGEVVEAIYCGGVHVEGSRPKLGDYFDVQTEHGENIPKYEKTHTGLRLLEEDQSKYDHAAKVKRDLLAKIAKLMYAGISPESLMRLELEGRGLMSFEGTDDMYVIEVAKRHPGVLMNLIEKTHAKSNDKDLVRHIRAMIMMKQTASCPLTKLISDHCKAKDEIQKSMFGLNNDRELSGFDVLDLL